MNAVSLINMFLGLALAPLLPGAVNRTKAFFAGRKGPPILQLYYDLFKLSRKGAVYSRTTTWVFRAGPVVSLAAALAAAAIVPFGGSAGPMTFAADFLLFAYVLGLMRFFTVIAALDTGSAFEGMGASREVQFSMLAEPALLLGLAALARKTGSLQLAGILGPDPAGLWAGPETLLVAAAFAVVILCENARVPFDDPNTHLELTMIHEVMVLDHSGPDLAFILYGAALKFWVTAALLLGVLLPVRTGDSRADVAIALGGMLALAVLIGAVESTMARLKLLRVPQLLAGATALAVLALVLVMR
jgi:formate hydrogenlyase subunit 4